MEYVRFGRTEHLVSRLGFGGAPAGLTNYLEPYSPRDTDQRKGVVAAIRRALELGVTYFDTAPGYGEGAGESIFGEALSDAGPEVFIATKVAPTTSDVRASVEASLRRLRRDHIDLVQIHGSTYSTDLANDLLEGGGIVDQLDDLRADGLVRFIGFTSEDNNPAVFRFIETGRFDVMQIAYNLVFQHPAEFTRPFGSMFEAKKHDMGICTMRTLTSGIFQKWVQQVNPSDTFDYTEALLQFVLSNPLVDVALVGMRTPEMVEQNVRICEDESGRFDPNDLHEKYT